MLKIKYLYFYDSKKLNHKQIENNIFTLYLDILKKWVNDYFHLELLHNKKINKNTIPIQELP